MVQPVIDKRSRHKQLKPLFVIKSPLTTQTRMQEEECKRYSKKVFAQVMEECVHDRINVLNFEESYRSAYNLQLHKRGAWVLDETIKAVRRLNFKPYTDERYFELVKAISDITMFSNKIAATQNLETTLQAAERLRKVRGLELWRLLVSKWAVGARDRRIERWKKLITQWRVAFNAVSMRPGSSGAQLAEDHFYSLATCNDTR